MLRALGVRGARARRMVRVTDLSCIIRWSEKVASLTRSSSCNYPRVGRVFVCACSRWGWTRQIRKKKSQKDVISSKAAPTKCIGHQLVTWLCMPLIIQLETDIQFIILITSFSCSPVIAKYVKSQPQGFVNWCSTSKRLSFVHKLFFFKENKA